MIGPPLVVSTLPREDRVGLRGGVEASNPPAGLRSPAANL